MDENIISENVSIADEDTALLPDGWTADSDIFSADDGGVTEDIAGGTLEADKSGTGPTTPGEDKTSAKLKFRATVDHQTRDVELDQAELPEMYQKAQVVDRVQAKLGRISPVYEQAERVSKMLGFDTVGDMLADAENRAVPAPAAPARNFDAEIDELVKAKPHILESPLPDEVVNDCVINGKPLVQAYLDFEEKRRADSEKRQQTAYSAVRAENEALRRSAQAVTRENRALRQNAEAAVRAPVRGVSGGGATDTTPGDDPFLSGFDSDSW